jgi:hypothetical protein
VVADFTYHDHVRVLSQHTPQAGGEREALFRVDLRLADAVDLVLDWVFERDNVRLELIEFAKREVAWNPWSPLI